MNWDQIEPIARQVDLWLSLAVNAWLVLTGVSIAFVRAFSQVNFDTVVSLAAWIFNAVVAAAVAQAVTFLVLDFLRS